LISWFCACLIGEVVGTSDNPILDTNGLELHALCIAGAFCFRISEFLPYPASDLFKSKKKSSFCAGLRLPILARQ
jgi:hypothetical protein